MAAISQSNLSFRFIKNRLYIRRNGMLAYEISVWPRPVASRCSESGTWEPFFPDFRLIDYPLRASRKKKVPPQMELALDLPEKQPELTKKEAYDLLRASMPLSYAISLARFRSHQWNLIILLSMKRRFYDLLKSNPVLAYYLANTPEVMRRIYRKELMMEDLAGMPQAGLAEILGIAPTKSMIRTLRKIAPVSASPGQVAQLQRCSRSEQRMKMLAHLQKINAGVLALASMPEPYIEHVTPQLLESVSRSGKDLCYSSIDTVLMNFVLTHRELDPDRRVPRFEHRDQLQHQLHVIETRYADIRNRKLMDKTPFEFPPPIPQTDTIVALTSPYEVTEEGRKQHHCVACHGESVKKGDTYIYRVLEPERATLEIRRGEDGVWRIGQIQLACNKQPKRETKMAVLEWLNQTQIGL